MGTENALQNMFNAYRAGTMTDSEMEQLDQMLVAGLLYHRERQVWLNLMSENGLVPLSDTIAPTSPTVWQKLRAVRFVAMGIAAALVLAISATWLLFQDNQSRIGQVDLVELNLQDASLPTPQTRMGTQTQTNEAWETARNALMDKDYTLAIQSLEKIPQRTVEQTFFLGIAYLKRKGTGDLTQSVGHLKRVLDLHTGNYEKEARWYLALCYLKLQQNDQARPLLEAIIAANDWKASEATAILATMKK